MANIKTNYKKNRYDYSNKARKKALKELENAPFFAISLNKNNVYRYHVFNMTNEEIAYNFDIVRHKFIHMDSL